MVPAAVSRASVASAAGGDPAAAGTRVERRQTALSGVGRQAVAGGRSTRADRR